MKILIVRFSSIGDIVLTTPVLRCLQQQLGDLELHYLTKQRFAGILQHNPYVDKVIGIEDSISEVLPELKKENYDLVIDLHRNLRTLRLKRQLGRPSHSFDKLNWEKFLLVRFKINKLPKLHIVERYLQTVKHLGVVPDEKGLDYFIPEKDQVNIHAALPALFHNGYYTLVAGGSYYTKQIPFDKLCEICRLADKPVVVLGGKEDAVIGVAVEQQFPDKVLNACGKFNLNQSASLIEQCEKVISSDTGLMHIASAFGKPIISVWGNTVPEFGMYPYKPGEGSKILEVQGLSCRPCSKLGYKKCPKGHFKCMNEIKIEL